MSSAPDKPYYATHVFCCINERPADHPRGCCMARDSQKLQNYMKAKAKALGIENIRINKSGCLDRCELGPVMVIYPEGVWYTYRTTADIDEILQEHIIGGKRVERLVLHPDQQELTPEQTQDQAKSA